MCYDSELFLQSKIRSGKVVRNRCRLCLGPRMGNCWAQISFGGGSKLKKKQRFYLGPYNSLNRRRPDSPPPRRVHRLNVEIAGREDHVCFQPGSPYFALLRAQLPLSAGLGKCCNGPQKKAVKQQNAKHLQDRHSRCPTDE